VKWDEGVVFTKRKLIEHIDNLMLKCDCTKANGWEEKINKKNELLVHLKKGTEQAPGKFLIKGVTYFNKTFKMERVVRSLYDVTQRSNWDKKQLDTLVSIDTDHKNVRLVYSRYKKFLIFNMKEYTDKMIQFRHKDSIYLYSTTNGLGVDQETQHLQNKDKKKKVDICDTIICCARFSTD